MTFTSTAAVAMHLGATPVLCDVLASNLTIDPQQVVRKLTDRTKVVIAVDYGGEAADYDGVRAATADRGVTLIGDAAHALPASYQGRSIGRCADWTAFSFYATKTITTGEGGMLVGLDGERLDRARTLALHGMSRDAWGRYEAGGHWKYDVVEAGYKFNLPDVLAAFGRVQLRRVQELWRKRRHIASAYFDGLGSELAIALPTPRSAERTRLASLPDQA